MKKLSAFIAILTATAFLVIPHQVFAISQDDLKSVLNDTTFYDPNDTGAPDCVTGSTTLVGNDNTDKIWNFLISKGITPEQAAGVMGNMQKESSFRPEADEPDSRAPSGDIQRGGIGIIQWTDPIDKKTGKVVPGRRTAIENAAKAKGVPVTDLAFQLDYLYEESSVVRNSRDYKGVKEWEGLKRQTTISDATIYWMRNSERPASTVATERIKYAEGVYAKYGKGTPAGIPDIIDSGCGGQASLPGIISKVSFQTTATIQPTAIILHWWGSNGAIDSLINTLKTRNLSVQLATTTDGKVYQLTPRLNSHAEHAKCANSWAIGNEIEGRGAADLAANDAQFRAVVQSTGEIMKKFNIPLDGPIAANGSSGKGIHSHKEVDAFCPQGSGKQDVDDAYLKRVKDELRKQGFK